MFDSIPDGQIAVNAGVTYQDATAMRDPLAGLLGGTEEENPPVGGADTILGEEEQLTNDGGAGSGNFGHSGRPGRVGGSEPGGSSGLTSKGKSGKLQSSISAKGENKFKSGFSTKGRAVHYVRYEKSVCGTPHFF